MAQKGFFKRLTVVSYSSFVLSNNHVSVVVLDTYCFDYSKLLSF
jgi:hypothetical protein